MGIERETRRVFIFVGEGVGSAVAGEDLRRRERFFFFC